MLRCPTSRHLVPAGDAGQTCSEGKQRAPPGCRGMCQKPTSRKYQAFCYRHCHFFFHSDRSPISRFQAFAKHESQLLVCFCLVSHSGSRVLLNQRCSANNHAKYTRYILSKEKLFTKMCSPRVTCTSSSNHAGIKLIYNIPSVGSPSCIFLWEELSSGLELGFYVPS